MKRDATINAIKEKAKEVKEVVSEKATELYAKAMTQFGGNKKPNTLLTGGKGAKAQSVKQVAGKTPSKDQLKAAEAQRVDMEQIASANKKREKLRTEQEKYAVLASTVEAVSEYLKKHPEELKKFTDPYQTLDVDCDGPCLKEIARLIRGFSGREIAKLFTGLQTHICAHITTSGAVTASQRRKLRLTRRTIIDVVKSKVEEHGRTVDVLAKGYEYVHQETGEKTYSENGSQNVSRAGTPFGSGNYGAQIKGAFSPGPDQGIFVRNTSHTTPTNADM